MAKVETLTAYKCTISYLQRNNPMIEEHRKLIKSGTLPDYKFSEFIEDYIKWSKKLIIGENSDRAISLAKENVCEEPTQEGTSRWYLNPHVGKQGKPITVVRITDNKKYNFSKDSAALYEHHIIAYEDDLDLVIMFYRQNGSGCKGVFLETANKVLHDKGYKLEMSMYLPPTEVRESAIPTKIILQHHKETKSSDITDHFKNKITKK